MDEGWKNNNGRLYRRLVKMAVTSYSFFYDQYLTSDNALKLAEEAKTQKYDELLEYIHTNLIAAFEYAECSLRDYSIICEENSFQLIFDTNMIWDEILITNLVNLFEADDIVVKGPRRIIIQIEV